MTNFEELEEWQQEQEIVRWVIAKIFPRFNIPNIFSLIGKTVGLQISEQFLEDENNDKGKDIFVSSQIHFVSLERLQVEFDHELIYFSLFFPVTTLECKEGNVEERSYTGKSFEIPVVNIYIRVSNYDWDEEGNFAESSETYVSTQIELWSNPNSEVKTSVWKPEFHLFVL